MSDHAQHRTPRQPSPGRRRGTALLAALVLTAVAASAAASAALSQESGPTRLTIRIGRSRPPTCFQFVIRPP